MLWTWIGVLLALLMIALAWAGVATQSARIWHQHFLRIERLMRERPEMQLVLDALPQREEEHRLVGVIVETRVHPNLAFVIRQVRAIVPGMPIQIFHGPGNRAFVQRSFEREIQAGEIDLTELRIDHFNVECDNWLMTSPRFYEACCGRHILVFQTDAVLFAKSRVTLAEFLCYDYVGARWFQGGERAFRRWSFRRLPPIGRVGNGGLSLRRRAKMIEAARAVPYLSVPFINEDVHFAYALDKVGAVLPSLAECDRFSFEEVLGEELPFGAHKFLPPRFRDQILAAERAILRDPSKPA